LALDLSPDAADRRVCLRGRLAYLPADIPRTLPLEWRGASTLTLGALFLLSHSPPFRNSACIRRSLR